MYLPASMATVRVPGSPTSERSRWIEAYKTQRVREGPVDLTRFVPERGHPHYGEVVHDLIRLDLEYGWAFQQPRALEEYQRQFPQAFQDRNQRAALAFQDYCLRLLAGERPDPADYQRRFGIDTASWQEALDQAHAAKQPPAAPVALPPGPESSPEEYSLSFRKSPAQDLDSPWPLGVEEDESVFPQAGQMYLGFRLVRELGRGAFGIVFLAQQESLANREVVIKISSDIGGEDQKLAQLLHTNIVPIYSVHRTTTCQAVCMPYLGATTLADVLKDIRRRGSVPESGKALVSTLNERKSTQVSSRLHESPGEGEGEKAALDRPSSAPRSGAFPHAENGGTSLPRAHALTPAFGHEIASTIILDKLSGLSYLDSILWIGSRLADGLAHAHEHGILHCDLKPANILLTDEGQPMLLDFNLAEDTKVRTSAAAAQQGGTLPYMSPEQLAGFVGNKQTLDGRSDLFALGVILFEFLTGRYPFPAPKGSPREVVEQMLRDRQDPPPRLRPWNKAITPAVEAIVRRCLECAPARRYADARALQEDVQRHLDNLPLKHVPEPSWRERGRKWMRRHPRLASSTTVALLAGMVLVALSSLLIVHGQRLRFLEALNTHSEFSEDLTTLQFQLTSQSADRTQLDEPLAVGQRALERYAVLTDAAWRESSKVRHLPATQQSKLQEDMGVLLLLMARAQAQYAANQPEPERREEKLRTALEFNQRAAACYPQEQAPPALWLQRADLLANLGKAEEAEQLRLQAAKTPLHTSQDGYLSAREYLVQGRLGMALPLLREVTRQDPQHVHAWFLLGYCHDGLGQYHEAVTSYTACIALWPKSHRPYFNRGLAYLRLKQFQLARSDFDQVLRKQPRHADAFFNRALAWNGLNRPKETLDDLTRALESDAPYTRVFFFRARVRDRVGDAAGARADRLEGLRLQPKDALSWIARGIARLPDDPKGALADYQKAMELNPRSLPALENLAHVLAERLGQTKAAVEILDQLLKYYPDNVPARASRGVLWARLGKRAAAHQDAKDALKRSQEAATQYQVAGIYALTSVQTPADRKEAFRLLATALCRGYGFAKVERDADLAPLHDSPEYRRLIEAVRTLRSGSAP